MQQVRIICKCGYFWITSINDSISIATIHEYFLNKSFNVGTDDNEKIVIPNQVLFKGIDYI